MRSIKISLMAVLAIVTTSLSTLADYMVREVGSFHVGGRTAALSGMPTKDVVFSPGAPPIKVDPNGEFAVEQMYVQFVKLAQPKAKVPILLWHGGGLTGVTWETKPDGKPGWQPADVPHQEGSLGAVPHRAELRDRRSAGRV